MTVHEEWQAAISTVKTLEQAFTRRQETLHAYAKQKARQGSDMIDGDEATKFVYDSLAAKDTVLADIDGSIQRAVAKATMLGIAVLIECK